MENLIKELSEKSNKLNIDLLIESNSYIDFNFKGEWTIAFVEREFEKIKYTLNILINNRQIHNAPDIRRNMYNMNPFRNNIYSFNYFLRSVILNEEYEDMSLKKNFKILEKKKWKLLKMKIAKLHHIKLHNFYLEILLIL